MQQKSQRHSSRARAASRRMLGTLQASRAVSPHRNSLRRWKVRKSVSLRARRHRPRPLQKKRQGRLQLSRSRARRARRAAVSKWTMRTRSQQLAAALTTLALVSLASTSRMRSSRRKFRPSLAPSNESASRSDCRRASVNCGPTANVPGSSS